MEREREGAAKIKKRYRGGWVRGLECKEGGRDGERKRGRQLRGGGGRKVGGEGGGGGRKGGEDKEEKEREGRERRERDGQNSCPAFSILIKGNSPHTFPPIYLCSYCSRYYPPPPPVDRRKDRPKR